METPKYGDPAFAKYLEKHPEAANHYLLRMMRGPADWLVAGAAVTIKAAGEPDRLATIVGVDDDLGIVEYVHGDA